MSSVSGVRELKASPARAGAERLLTPDDLAGPAAGAAAGGAEGAVEEQHELASDSEEESSSSSSSRALERCRADLAPSPKACALIAISLLTVIGGAISLQWAEGCSFLEACWVITQVITTVGYGDITFEHEKTRIFMSIYVLWLLVCVAYVLNEIMERILRTQSRMLAAKLKMYEEYMEHHHSHHRHRLRQRLDQVTGELYGEFEGHITKHANKNAELIRAGSWFLGHLLFGMLFYHWYERCACSYGHTLVDPACTPGNACQRGSHKTLITSFYMSVVTLTTVGFGDVTPMSSLGRVIGIPWMLSGIYSTGNFVSVIQRVLLAQDKTETLEVNSESMAAAMREKGEPEDKGGLTKAEFITFVLVNNGLVEESIVRRVSALYDKMDIDRNGVITHDELREFQRLKNRELAKRRR